MKKAAPKVKADLRPYLLKEKTKSLQQYFNKIYLFKY